MAPACNVVLSPQWTAFSREKGSELLVDVSRHCQLFLELLWSAVTIACMASIASGNLLMHMHKAETSESHQTGHSPRHSQCLGSRMIYHLPSHSRRALITASSTLPPAMNAATLLSKTPAAGPTQSSFVMNDTGGGETQYLWQARIVS